MFFGPSNSSAIFAASRDPSAAGLGLIGPSASATLGASGAAASACCSFDVTAVSATATLRGAFVACAGPGAVSVVAMKRPSGEGRAGVAGGRGAGGALQQQPASRLVVSPVATQATASPAVASCIAVTPIRGSSATGRTATHFDRAAIVSGSACGTVEVFEASTPGGDVAMLDAPDLRRVGLHTVPSLLGAFATQAALDDAARSSPGVQAIAGASSAAYGVSWIAIATRSTLVILDAAALLDTTAGGIEPLAVLDGCAPDSCNFHGGFSGAAIIDVASVLPGSSDASSSGAASGGGGGGEDSDDADAAADVRARIAPNASLNASAWGEMGLTHGGGGVDGSVKDVPAFNVTWSDGTVHTVRAVLLPVTRGKQPVEFYSARSVDPAMLFAEQTPAVTVAASSPVPSRSAHLQGAAAPCVRTIAITANNECYVALYPPAAGSDSADADDERTPAPIRFRIPTAMPPAAVATVDLEEGSGRGVGTAVVAATGSELLVSRWERTGGTHGRGSLRPLRAVAAFDAAISALTVLPAGSDRHGSQTAPSTPASRTSAGAASSGVSRSAGSNGPVAIVAVERGLFFVLL